MTLARAFIYHNQTFMLHIPTLPAPPAPRDLSAPGAGEIAIESLALAAAAQSPDQDVTLTATVRGTAIAHIFIEVWLYDEELKYAYGPVYQEHLRAADQETLDGVLRPVWPETVNVAVTFHPTMRALSDGAASAFVFATPETYAAPDVTAYRLPGRFQAADSDIARSAHLYFDHTGQMTQVMGLGGLGSLLARPLTPQPGDIFIPEGQVLLHPAQPGAAWGEGDCFMSPLAFSKTPFRWEILPLLPHTYQVGLVVVDLDGGLTRHYTPLTLLPPAGTSAAEFTPVEKPSFFSSLKRGWNRFFNRLFGREAR